MSILPQLERDLFHAAQCRLPDHMVTVGDRGEESAEELPVSTARARRRLRPRGTLIIAMAVAALIAAGVAGAAGVFSPTRVSGNVHALPGRRAQSVSSRMRATFPLLARPRVPRDEIPRWLLGGDLGQSQHDLGINPSLSRLVASNSVIAMWLIPGRQGVCAVTWWERLPGGRASAVNCTSITAALRGGMLTVDTFGVFGVLPKGTRDVSVSERSRTLAVQPDVLGVVAVLARSPVTSFRYITPDGAHHVVSL